MAILYSTAYSYMYIANNFSPPKLRKKKIIIILIERHNMDLNFVDSEISLPLIFLISSSMEVCNHMHRASSHHYIYAHVTFHIFYKYAYIRYAICTYQRYVCAIHFDAVDLQYK